MEENKSYHCGLIGSPVKHSLSPIIHGHFAAQFDMDLEYSLFDTSAEDVEETILSFFAGGGTGLNITMPYKNLAYRFCKQHSVISKTTRTVNTVWMGKNHELSGDNTDATGFIRDLRHNQKFDAKNKRVLVIGAGGVAQAIIPTLFVQKVGELYILNRTMSRAEELVKHYGEKRGAKVLDPDKNKQAFDLIINATSASIYGTLPNVNSRMIGEHTYCVDLAYTKTSTIFCDWAQENGAERVWDGLGMLIEQAADAFGIWFKQRPDTLDLYKQRYKLLAGSNSSK
ncbi:MAG: shikimate dehydrogenase [Gammaproteobacteria bacterium]|nr:shikimate dehydrogenase [Gammaproteobacteria bacterium]